jgi:hypothetical protein
MTLDRSKKRIAAMALASAAAIAAGKPLQTETIKFDSSMLTRQPSIALKHLSLEGVTLGAPAIEVDLYCDIRRETGLLECSRAHRERAGDEFVIAAIRRSRALRLDTANLEPDNAAPLRTNLTVVLARSERHTIDFLDAPRLTMTDVRWADQPTASDIEAVYPQDLLRQGMTATVALVCQIQADLSLLCATADPAPAGDAKALEAYKKFSWAGAAIMSLYTAAPALKSGAPSVGAVIATMVDFKPRD